MRKRITAVVLSASILLNTGLPAYSAEAEITSLPEEAGLEVFEEDGDTFFGEEDALSMSEEFSVSDDLMFSDEADVYEEDESAAPEDEFSPLLEDDLIIDEEAFDEALQIPDTFSFAGDEFVNVEAAEDESVTVESVEDEFLLEESAEEEVNAAASAIERSQADAVSWVYQQEGKGLDYDGAYGCQCVDLIKYYYDYFGVAEYARGNGNEYASNTLPPNWTRIQNTPDFVPQPGDIMVWGTGIGKNGHVAIVLSADVHTFVSMDQNWPSGSPVKQVSHNYNSVWGVIRPAYSPGPVPPIPPDPVVHEIQSHIDSASGGTGSVRISGWAYDPEDSSGQLRIDTYVGGSAGSGAPGYGTYTSGHRPEVNSTYGIDGLHGFDATFNVSVSGSKTLYIYAINERNGKVRLLGTQDVSITSGNADHKPIGSLDVCTAANGKIRVAGWAKDEDTPNAGISVHVYVGGPAGTSGAEGFNLKADGYRSDVGYHAFDKTLDVAKRGNQSIYVYAINNDSKGGNPVIGSKTVNITESAPRGGFETCTGLEGAVEVSGWALDDDTPDQPVTIHVYIGGSAGSGAGEGHAITGGKTRPDGTKTGFSGTISTNKLGTQDVYVYAINTNPKGANRLLGKKSVTIREVKPLTYTVSYDANGGSGAPAAQTKTKGVPLTLSTVKPSLDYTVTYNANGGTCSTASAKVAAKFLWWQTGTDGGAPFQSGSSYANDQDVTLYAHWEAGNLTSLPEASKPGYEFDGWYTASVGGTKVTASTLINANKTFYAHYTSNAEHNPAGTLDAAFGGEGHVRVAGWAYDPDDTSKNLVIRAYVGGDAASGVRFYSIPADKTREDAGYGGNHGYDSIIDVPDRGSKTVYVYAENIGAGDPMILLGQGTVMITEHTHTYRSDITKAATCTTEGILTKTCTKCGASKTEIIPAKGHTFADTIVAPTCTENGYTLHRCSICGYSSKDSYKNAVGHQYNSTVQEPTCTQGGYTEHVCVHCGNQYKDGYTSALGHNWGSGTVKIQATCAAEGLKEQTCKRCKETREVTIPIDENHHTGAVEIRDMQEAALNSDGYTGDVYCRDCGKLLSEGTVIPGIEEPETEEPKAPETEEPKIPETEEPEIPETEEPEIPETEEPEIPETEEPEILETEEPETLETEEPEDPETEEPEDPRSELSSGRISGLKDLTYTGAALTQKMEVIVDGSILKPGKDYKVTYKNNKAVGTAQVKVTGTGNYTGTLSGSFSINPKPVKLKKLTGKKKSITVKWEKPSAQVSGCQIQYSISKTFESESRILTAAGKNKKSAKIKNLKAKKTYYVRIRTYKTVNGQTYYSAWSKSMKIKTKK